MYTPGDDDDNHARASVYERCYSKTLRVSRAPLSSDARGTRDQRFCAALRRRYYDDINLIRSYKTPTGESPRPRPFRHIINVSSSLSAFPRPSVLRDIMLNTHRRTSLAVVVSVIVVIVIVIVVILLNTSSFARARVCVYRARLYYNIYSRGRAQIRFAYYKPNACSINPAARRSPSGGAAQ